MQMEMYTKVNGVMIRLTARANTIILMELSTKETGKMINNMDMAWRLGQTELSIKEIIKTVRKMELGSSYGPMVLLIRVNSWITISMVKASTRGLINGSTTESG